MSKYKSIQLRVYQSTHRKLKHTALLEGLTLAEYILRVLANHDNPEIAKLIQAELKHRPKPGEHQKPRRMHLKLLLKHLPPKVIRSKFANVQ